MRPAPFIARWQVTPPVSGSFEARLRLDDESWFVGHYPGAPIFRGSLLVEALFQAASLALGGEVRLEELVACRFHSPLFPGDEIVASIALKDAGAGSTLVEASAKGRAPAAQATMLVVPDRSGTVDLGPAANAGAAARALDASFIRGVLPHRPPALLIDDADVLGPSTLVARKHITPDEPRSAGADTPSLRSYPVALVVESFCQACGLLRAATATARESYGNKVPVVAKLANLRFGGGVGPGNVLEHHVRMISRLPDGAVFSGETAVAGRVVLQVGRVVAALASL